MSTEDVLAYLAASKCLISIRYLKSNMYYTMAVVYFDILKNSTLSRSSMTRKILLIVKHLIYYY